MMVPTHLTAQQIADLKLEGLPTSAYRVRTRAISEGWDYLQKPDCHGGRHFAVASLPETAKADLEARILHNRQSKLLTHCRGFGRRFCCAVAAAVKIFAFEMRGDA